MSAIRIFWRWPLGLGMIAPNGEARLHGRIFLALAAFAVASGVQYWWSVRDLDPAVIEARYITASDRFLTIDGARTRIREEGPVDAPTVVLIHGFTDSLESWDGWAENLAEQFQVVRYDLRGHGLTGPDPRQRYGVEARARFLGELLDTLGVEQASIAGAGLGGYIAWKYALEEPSRVDRLVLVAPMAFPYAGVGPEPDPAPAWMRRVPKLAPWWGWRRVVASDYADPRRALDEEIGRRRDMARRRGNAAAYVDHVRTLTVPADPAPQLAGLGAPTLLLWGAWDAIIPDDQVGFWEEVVPDLEAIVFPNLGHAPHRENPGVTAVAARAFLRGQTDRP